MNRPGHEPLCPWHDAQARPEKFNVKQELEKEIQSDNHWLEGARLAMEDLRNLSGQGARLPSADLEGATLDDALLHKAILDDTSLVSTELPRAKLGYASLVGTRMDCANLFGADLTHCNVSGARLHGTVLDQATLFGARLDGETLLVGVVWGIAGELLHQHFEKAASVFRNLRVHFRSLSNLQEADHFYYWEMTALHLGAINAEFNPQQGWFSRWRIRSPRILLKWIGWALHRWIWGYGVRPYRTLWWMLFVVLCFGLIIFPAVGIQQGDTVKHNLLSGLALSVVTLATLGYGNRTPCGEIGELLGGLEAIIGALLMSVFVVGLAGRYVHVN